MKMLDKIFSKPPQPPAAQPRWNISSVEAVLHHFPIGSRLLYYPEAKKELRLESVLIGCTINRIFVFSQGQVRFEKDAEGDYLTLSGDSGETRIRAIQSFYLLIPHQVRSEIDYQSTESPQPSAQLYQKEVNDFNKDALITLMCYSPYGRVPHMETSVKTVSILQKGFYANHRAVALDPFFATLTEVDQRRHHRISTELPLVLKMAGDETAFSCILEDFSERFIRVRLPEGQGSAERFAAGRRLALALDLSERSSPFTLQGSVHRNTADTIVIELKAILKSGKFVELQLVDQLAFKAALLEHPATQAAIRKPKPAPVGGGE